MNAVEVSFTVVNPTNAGNLYGYQGGVTAPAPQITYVNFLAGAVTTNSAVLAVGSGGGIQIEVSQAANVVVDVEGYYTTGATVPGGFVPLSATQVAAAATIQQGVCGQWTVAGVAGVPSNASSVMLSIAETSPQGTTSGWVTPYPSPSDPDWCTSESSSSFPKTSLDWPKGQNYEWSVPVRLGVDGKVSVYVGAGGPTNLTLIVQGYFTATTAGSNTSAFTPAQARAYDSRTYAKPVQSGNTQTVPLEGVAGIPGVGSGITAIVASVTVLAGSTGGHLQAFADNGSPGPAYMQFAAGQTTSVMMTVPVGADGGIDLQNTSGTAVNIVVDVEGWFTLLNATTCAADTVQILHQQQTGASDDDPVVSAVLVSGLGSSVEGNIYVTDSNGNLVGGQPIATGTIDSGTALTFHIPPADLTPGSTYSWYVQALIPDACYQSPNPSVAAALPPAQSSTMSFTMATPPPQTVTITGSALSMESNPEGTDACDGTCNLSSTELGVGYGGYYTWLTSLKADLSAVPAGAIIDTATLELTQSICLTGFPPCGSGTIDVNEAASDVAAAQTGDDLFSIAESPVTTDAFAATNGTSNWDITNLVNTWYTGGSTKNLGAVLTMAGTGIGQYFYPPSSAVDPAKIVITYTSTTPPAVTPVETPGPDTLAITGSSLSMESNPEGTDACDGTCDLSATELGVGFDSYYEWITSLKADLSAVPAGATIDTATLELTQSSCLNNDPPCGSGTIDVDEAASDVAIAQTADDLVSIAAAPAGTDTFTETNGTSNWDITNIVNDWYTNGPAANLGAVLTTSGTNIGQTFYPPTSTTDPAKIVITYTPAATPTAVQSLAPIAGDGGVLASWQPPQDPGYVDTTDGGDGISSYLVTVQDSNGNPVTFTDGSTGTLETSETVLDSEAVINGLSDGQTYTLTVTPVNPVGSGTASTSTSFAPEAVSGGPSQYVGAVQQILDGADSMQQGITGSALDATAGDTAQSLIEPALSTVAASDVGTFDTMSLSSQQDTVDTNALSSSLVVPGLNGAATVFTTDDESFTTVDTSDASSPDDIPGSQEDRMAVMFGSVGGALAITGAAEQDALLTPLTETAADTAATPAAQAAATTQIADLVADGGTREQMSILQPIASWADTHTGSKADISVIDARDQNLSGNGCTDFVSQALNDGGGFPQVGSSILPGHHNDGDTAKDDWFYVSINIAFLKQSYTQTWANAPDSLQYWANRGQYVGRVEANSQDQVLVPASMDVEPGMIAYTNFNSAGPDSVDHAAIIDQVKNGNLYIDQADNIRRHESVSKGGTYYWAGSPTNKNSRISVWIVDP